MTISVKPQVESIFPKLQTGKIQSISCMRFVAFRTEVGEKDGDGGKEKGGWGGGGGVGFYMRRHRGIQMIQFLVTLL